MKIAIASGKGGTGKTTLSTNLAAYLSESHNLVLADLDVEEPNSGLFIQGRTVLTKKIYKKIPEWIPEQCTLCGLCREVCNFNAITQILDEILVFPQLCHACHACSELCPQDALPMKEQAIGTLAHAERGDLSFVEGILDIGEEQAVPLIAQTIDYIDEIFSDDTIKIFDAPPGTSCPMIEVVKNADFVILITEPTPVGLHDLSLAVETIRELKKEFAVVINRFGIGNTNVETYCINENIPLMARIPDQRNIAELYSEGKLLYQDIPGVKKALNDIIGYLGIPLTNAMSGQSEE